MDTNFAVKRNKDPFNENMLKKRWTSIETVKWLRVSYDTKKQSFIEEVN